MIEIWENMWTEPICQDVDPDHPVCVLEAHVHQAVNDRTMAWHTLP